MWNRENDTDILDFALLWEPLGGPAPETVTAAFAIDISEYTHRLRKAARTQLTRLQYGVTSAEHIYRLSAMTALGRDPAEARRTT